MKFSAKPCLRHYLSLEIVPVCIKLSDSTANVLLLFLLPYFLQAHWVLMLTYVSTIGNKVDYI